MVELARQEDSMLVLLALLFALAFADEPSLPKPMTQVTVAVTYPLSLRTFVAYPPSVAYGFGVLLPLKRGFGYYTEASVTTGFTDLRPGIQMITGLTKKVSSKLVLGGSALYKVMLPYGGAPPTHIIGGALVPVTPLSFGAVSFPLGFGYNVNTRDPTLSANFKITLRLQ